MSFFAPANIRVALLVSVALSLVMAGIKVFRYPPLLAIPSGPTYVVETAIVLLLYGIVSRWVTGSDQPLFEAALLIGTPVGLVASAVQISHLATEGFVHSWGPWEGIAAVAFGLSTFLIWGVAGYRSARKAGAIAPGIVSGAWSAIVTMSILVTFGFAFEFYLAVPRPEDVATWGEFARSGWTDVRAFTIANTLGSALSHLVLGPLVGAIFGGIGGMMAVLAFRSGPPPQAPGKA